MKTAPSIALLVLALPLCLAAQAFGAEADREADHAALRALRDKIATAINQQDVKTMLSCFAKEFAFTAVTQTVMTNEAQITGFYDRMFRGPDALIASLKTEPKADIPTRFLDERTGICHGTSKETYTLKSGDVVVMDVRWSATVVKEDDGWKVAIAHIGTDFLDNPVLSRANSYWKKITIGAAVAGVVIGALTGFLLFRRKSKTA